MTTEQMVYVSESVRRAKRNMTACDKLKDLFNLSGYPREKKVLKIASYLSIPFSRQDIMLALTKFGYQKDKSGEVFKRMRSKSIWEGRTGRFFLDATAASDDHYIRDPVSSLTPHRAKTFGNPGGVQYEFCPQYPYDIRDDDDNDEYIHQAISEVMIARRALYRVSDPEDLEFLQSRLVYWLQHFVRTEKGKVFVPVEVREKAAQLYPRYKDEDSRLEFYRTQERYRIIVEGKDR